jgi:hypothetical protein
MEGGVSIHMAGGDMDRRLSFAVAVLFIVFVVGCAEGERASVELPQATSEQPAAEPAESVEAEADAKCASVMPVAILGARELECTVGKPCSLDLSASGGSGSYVWDATGLLLGLDFSDGKFSGEPNAFGKTTVRVQASDSTCPSMIASANVTLDVARDVTYSKPVARLVDTSKMPRKVTIEEQKALPIVPLPAEEGEAEGGGDGGDEELFARKIRIELWTADVDESGTDHLVYYRFCGDEGLVRESEYGTDKDGNPVWKHDLPNLCVMGYLPPNVNSESDGDSISEALKYFEQGSHDTFYVDCKLGDEKCDFDDLPFFKLIMSPERLKSAHGEWLLQGIRITKLYYSDGDDLNGKARDEQIYYYNPCFLQTSDQMSAYSIADSAACVVLETFDEDGAGTDDEVYLMFKGIYPIYLETGYTWGGKQGKGMYDGEFGLPYGFAWKDYNDFERGRRDAYGVTYSYCEKSGTKTCGTHSWFVFGDKEKRQFAIEKSEDGKYGGWKLGRVSVYVFRPGKSFANGNDNLKDFYGATYDVNAWIEDDDLRWPASGYKGLNEMKKLPGGFSDKVRISD